MPNAQDEKFVPPPFIAAEVVNMALNSQHNNVLSVAHQNLNSASARAVIRLFFYSVLAACGGFLLGYDNGIMGGVSSNNNYLELFFPEVMSSKTSGRGSVYCV
jgi:hypothetical protein